MCFEEADEVVVRISDNGSGIAKDQLEHIFDRFYKGDASRNTDIGSSGLGLSISKQIVQAHGGKIWATSEIEKGTIIYFTLSKRRIKMAKILIIEDESNIAELEKDYLESHNYEVDIESDGVLGLEKPCLKPIPW